MRYFDIQSAISTSLFDESKFQHQIPLVSDSEAESWPLIARQSSVRIFATSSPACHVDKGSGLIIRELCYYMNKTEPRSQRVGTADSSDVRVGESH